MPQYRVTGGPAGNAGLDYKSRRVEPGDIVDDLPRESIKWLREQGYIEAVGKDAPSKDAETPDTGLTDADSPNPPDGDSNALEGESADPIDGGQ